MGSLFHIKTDIECRVYHGQEEKCIASPNNDATIVLQEGLHKLSFTSTENPRNSYSILCEVLTDDSEECLDVHLSQEAMRLNGSSISREQKRIMGMNLARFHQENWQLDQSLRIGYYDETEPQYYSDKDYCQEYIIRSRLSSLHTYNSALFTIRPWITINDMLMALVRYDQYNMPESAVSFSQSEWENVTRDGDIDYRLLKRMLKDNLLIMKVLLTVLSIKESNNEYKISFKTMPDVKGHMDYTNNARYEIDLTVLSGVIKTNRLYYDEHSNTFQSFWPSFSDEEFILNALEDRYQFMRFPLHLLDENEQVRQITHELKNLAESLQARTQFR